MGFFRNKTILGLAFDTITNSENEYRNKRKKIKQEFEESKRTRFETQYEYEVEKETREALKRWSL